MPKKEPGMIRQDVSSGHDANIAGRDQIFNLVPAEEKSAPGLLPRDVPDFKGRVGELGRASALARGGSAVAAIGGAPGVGKTALAAHAAHQLLPRFPGGHLYVDLRGYTEGQSPAEPGEVLDMFLRRLGIAPDKVPAGVEERSGLLRQLLATRPVLMVLDNAAAEAQVRPLLPGAGSSLVLITSRSALAGLDLDDRIDVDVLSGPEATALLAKLIGPERAAAEPEAVAQVAQLCGCLPLALRIAGQLLAVHPAWQVTRLAGMLADERHRLERLAVGDRQVRAAFEVSYRQLARTDARMFRLLGLHQGPDFDAPTAAALAELKPGSAKEALDRLALAYMITEDAGGRFRLHDLLRLFARQTCEAVDDDTIRDQATVRLMDHFRDLAIVLRACLQPQLYPDLAREVNQVGKMLPSPRQALTMFEADRRNLVSAVILAANHGEHRKVWQLGENIGETLVLLRHLDDAATVFEAALSAARAAQDAAAEDRALNNLGNAYYELQRPGDAIRCYEQDLLICREAADRVGEGVALTHLGMVYGQLEQHDKAIASFQASLTILQEAGDKQAEGVALINLGMIYREMQRYDDAITSLKGSMAILRETGDKRGEGRALTHLGMLYREMQQYDDAITSFHASLANLREVGDLYGEGHDLTQLGMLYREMQQYDDAITSFQDAIEAIRGAGDAGWTAWLEQAINQMHQGKRHWWQRMTRTRKRSDPAR